MLLLFLSLPVRVPAQFLFVTNGNTITIIGYTGPGGELDIPSEIYGLSVVSISLYFSAYFPPTFTNCPQCMHLPWVGHRSPDWEAEPLRWLGMNAGLRAMNWADRQEARTGRPSLVAQFAGRFLGG